MAHSDMPGQLKRYWGPGGAGGAKIRWGEDGDFDRCIVEIEKAITKDGRAPLPPNVIKGLCASLHKENTGATPGHAPGESHK